MTMSKMKWKLMLAGVVVACAFGGFAIGIAWATPGHLVFPVPLSARVTLDELDIGNETDTHEIEIKTRGRWDTVVVHYTIKPGGHTGWHTHPGPVFVMINEGTMTKYEADGSAAVYPAGTGFVEGVHDHPHIAGNEEDSDLKFVAFFLVPQGAPLRIDHPAP
jgi:quercetin dioxygenase-like cupin family protein